MSAKAFYKVTQITNGETYRIAFDADEWRYRWIKCGKIELLRLEHDGDHNADESYHYVEFSTPVNIELIDEASMLGEPNVPQPDPVRRDR